MTLFQWYVTFLLWGFVGGPTPQRYFGTFFHNNWDGDNHNKLALLTFGLDDAIFYWMDKIFNFQHLEFDDGIKYSGFILKENNYGKEE